MPTRTPPSRRRDAHHAEAHAATKKVAFTPERKLRLWVAGDSLVITPGYAIVRAVGREPGDRVRGRSRRAGRDRAHPPGRLQLVRGDPPPAQGAEAASVVLAFGGNDDKAYMTGLPDGVSIDAFGGSVWRSEYGRRVGGLMDTINRAGAFVVWIGLPQTRSPEQTQRFDIVNAVVQREARKRAGGPRSSTRTPCSRETTAGSRSTCRTPAESSSRSGPVTACTSSARAATSSRARSCASSTASTT